MSHFSGDKLFLVISYDIVDDKKRNKVANLLEDYGKRVQYSVFECRLNKKLFDRAIKEILPFIDEEVDSLRVYWLCERCVKEIKVYGIREVSKEEEEDVIVV